MTTEHLSGVLGTIAVGLVLFLVYLLGDYLAKEEISGDCVNHQKFIYQKQDYQCIKEVYHD